MHIDGCAEGWCRCGEWTTSHQRADLCDKYKRRILMDRLAHYQKEPIKNLANDPKIDRIFNKIADSRGYC